MKEQTTDSDQNVKDSLREAGIKLFAQKGYKGTSVREIVAAAGVTKPVLYYYFKNKDGLFLDIMGVAAEGLEGLEVEMSSTKGTFFDRLKIFCSLVFQWAKENKELFTFIHQLSFGPPSGTPSFDVWQYQRRMVEIIEGIYNEGFEKGETREAIPADVAAIVLGILDFCFHEEVINSGLTDIDRIDHLLELAFKGLSANNKQEEGI